MIGGHYIYWFAFTMMVIGLYTVISHGNLVKKLIGLNLFQIGVFMFYISLGKVEGGHAPIIEKGVETYSHPLPHVLILTAIVVGVATTSLGLALAVRIYESYGTLEEDEVIERDKTDDGPSSSPHPPPSNGRAPLDGPSSSPHPPPPNGRAPLDGTSS